jgi:ADP-glucose pyrophosphorylase
MPFARIEDGARVERAIVAEHAVVGRDCHIGAPAGEKAQEPSGGITLVAHDVVVPDGAVFCSGSVIDGQIAEGKEETA